MQMDGRGNTFAYLCKLKNCTNVLEQMQAKEVPHDILTFIYIAIEGSISAQFEHTLHLTYTTL